MYFFLGIGIVFLGNCVSGELCFSFIFNRDQSRHPDSVFSNGLAEQFPVESVVLVTTREPSVLLTVHQMEDMLLSRAVVTSF